MAEWSIKKNPDLGYCPSNHAKYFLKILPMNISIGWSSFMTKYIKKGIGVPGIIQKIQH